MTKREEFAAKARSWIGTKEGSAAHRQIVADYNKACDKGRRGSTSSLWCAMFVGAVAQETGNVLKDGIGVPVDYSCGKGPHSLIEKAKAAGIWVENDAYNPIIGDIVIYDWDDNGKGDDTSGHDHTGIVTIGTSGGSSSFTVTEGNRKDQVLDRSMQVNGRYIRGFITPRFADEIEPPKPQPEPQPQPTPAPTPSGELYKVKTNGSNLRLRVAPNLKAVVIASMPNSKPGKPTLVTVTGTSGSWSRVTYNGRTGWAATKWLAKI
jgi:hypothetical protein